MRSMSTETRNQKFSRESTRRTHSPVRHRLYNRSDLSEQEYRITAWSIHDFCRGGSADEMRRPHKIPPNNFQKFKFLVFSNFVNKQNHTYFEAHHSYFWSCYLFLVVLFSLDCRFGLVWCGCECDSGVCRVGSTHAERRGANRKKKNKKNRTQTVAVSHCARANTVQIRHNTSNNNTTTQRPICSLCFKNQIVRKEGLE